jgi:hypothetical protein
VPPYCPQSFNDEFLLAAGSNSDSDIFALRRERWSAGSADTANGKTELSHVRVARLDVAARRRTLRLTSGAVIAKQI